MYFKFDLTNSVCLGHYFCGPVSQIHLVPGCLHKREECRYQAVKGASGKTITTTYLHVETFHKQ